MLVEHAVQSLSPKAPFSILIYNYECITTDVSKNSRYVKYSTYVLNEVSETTAVQVYNKTTAYCIEK